MSHIKLVKATKKDIPTLVDFLGQLFMLEKDFEPDPESQASALNLIMENPEQTIIYIVEVDGGTAGMVALHLSISTAEGGWAGRIEDLYLKPEFRRQGIGKQVVQEILSITKEKGLKRITLVADKDNSPALQFYKSCGFQEMNLTSFARRIK